MLFAQIAESESKHPIANAICKYATQKLTQEDRSMFKHSVAENLKHHGGRGLECVIDSHQVVVGNLLLMQQQHIPIGPHIEQLIQKLQLEQQTILILSLDGTVAAVLSLSDSIREEVYHINSVEKDSNMTRGNDILSKASMTLTLCVYLQAHAVFATLQESGVEVHMATGISNVLHSADRIPHR